MAIKAGNLDRRITVERAVKKRDSSNGEITTWEPAFRRWARKSDNTGQETNTDTQTIRYFDTVWNLRSDRQSIEIAPDTHRIKHHGVVYRIVAINEQPGRLDGLRILSSSRNESEAAYGPQGA